MKTLICLFILTAVNAALVVKDIDVLFQRASELEKNTIEIIATHSNVTYRRHLLANIETHSKESTKIKEQLQSLLKHNLTYRIGQLNRLEEALLFNENRVNEEVLFIKEIDTYPKSGNKTDNELIEYGTKLLKLGADFIEKYRHIDPKIKEIFFIEVSMEMIQKMIADLAKNKATGYNREDDEIHLLLHERKLKALVERVQLEFNIPYLDP